ncbi:hypothetical protein HZ326_18054 [Fusarium oxysporum f. sp. albedinis]|nr:hypothetical protein HZ326_18054 [Fusarium oxysporum f. sp. albedinis]
MTTVSLTVSRNVVTALCIVIPLIFIVLIIIIISLCLNKHPRHSQSHESDEFPLKSSHSTASAQPGYCPCIAVIGTEKSIKHFLKVRGYKDPSVSYYHARGHFRMVCNPPLNDKAVNGVVILPDASPAEKYGWMMSKRVVVMGTDPVGEPWWPSTCTLGLADPFDAILGTVIHETSTAVWI